MAGQCRALQLLILGSGALRTGAAACCSFCGAHYAEGLASGMQSLGEHHTG